MISQLELSTLQQIWWLIVSVVGGLFLFLTFVQGGQTLLFTTARTEEEKGLIINSLGRKWELTFTTLVLFGGALFAAFPLFYATSFGGAYWVWMCILLTFIIQAVSYEFRRKPGNLLGAGTYEIFLLINGSVGLLLIGAAVGTFFTGAQFSLNDYRSVSWQTPYHGLEAALHPFNLAMGFFLVFLARMLGAMYLVTNIDHAPLQKKLCRAAGLNFLLTLPFLLAVLGGLAFMPGFAVEPESGRVFLEQAKYLHNLLAMPLVALLLGLGVGMVLYGALTAWFTVKKNGIWFGGSGTVLVAIAIFLLAGYNQTAFYPSAADPQASLTIFNASSSKYTLTAMTYVALLVPFVLAYVAYVWKKMDARSLSLADLTGEEANDLY